MREPPSDEPMSARGAAAGRPDEPVPVQPVCSCVIQRLASWAGTSFCRSGFPEDPGNSLSGIGVHRGVHRQEVEDVRPVLAVLDGSASGVRRRRG
jgi:hypothetical protein